jgi:hypothetical protein
MVQMQRQMQSKHAEKLQNNLHLIDLPRQNQSINFISDLSEIPRSVALPEAAKSEPPVDPNSRLAQEIRHLQSENKQQYKRLADAVGKADQYSRV